MLASLDRLVLSYHYVDIMTSVLSIIPDWLSWLFQTWLTGSNCRLSAWLMQTRRILWLITLVLGPLHNTGQLPSPTDIIEKQTTLRDKLIIQVTWQAPFGQNFSCIWLIFSSFGLYGKFHGEVKGFSRFLMPMISNEWFQNMIMKLIVF